MKNIAPLFLLILAITSCGRQPKDNTFTNSTVDSIETVRPTGLLRGNTVKTRYQVPEGFHRVITEKGSFGEFLQNLPLHPQGYPTHLFNGQEKHTQISTSVINMDIDSVDLQQCADAIIRLRAEYLYQTRQFDKIHFNFTNGFECNYMKWAQGFRVKTEGNKTRWYKAKEEEDYSYDTFREYLLKVFEYAGTISLATELTSIPKEDLTVGTIILQPGSPGHAMIVVDMIEPNDSVDFYKGKGVLLAQSFMPAQEIEIVKGYYDELGMFSKIKYPKIFNNLWSPTRFKNTDDKFFTTAFYFEKPLFLTF